MRHTRHNRQRLCRFGGVYTSGNLERYPFGFGSTVVGTRRVPALGETGLTTRGRRLGPWGRVQNLMLPASRLVP